VSFRHLWAVTRKEIQHILRDRITFFLVIMTPVVLFFIFSYSLAVKMQHIPIAVLDYDRGQMARAFVQQITAGDDLELFAQVNSMEEIEGLLMRGEVKAALILDPAFSRDLLTMKGLNMQIIIDGTEPESGGFAADHIGWRAQEYIQTAMASQIEAMGVSPEALQPVDLRVRTWYNPGLKAENALIPGMLSIILGLPAMSVALTLAREREHGTLEQLMATPVKRIELLLGKLLPYILISLVDVVFLTLLAMAWFRVPMNGSFPLFFTLSAIFLFSILSMGLLIGVFIPTQPAALALSFLLIFFPGFFLTGIFFPIVSMPELMRMEAMFLPGTHYAYITRAIFLPGLGIDVLWPYALMLIVLGLAFTGVAALFFRKRLG
jgi:ABC-2 type transport system permease protein